MRNDLERLPSLICSIALLSLVAACAPEALSEDPDGNVDPSADMGGGGVADMTGGGETDMGGGGADLGGGGNDMENPGTDMGGGGGLMNPFTSDDAAALSAGQVIYAGATADGGQGCSGCHGMMGMGAGSFPALTDSNSKSDEYLFTIIKDGEGLMPAYGGSITDEQIWQVITYIQASFGS